MKKIDHLVPLRSSDKWDLRMARLAKEVSTWSKDPSTQVGVVIVDERMRVLSQGYNGFPRGIDDDPHLLDDREEKLKRIIHAEMNAIFNACYNGVSLDESSLYIWGLPVCSDCAKGVIQVGVRNVFIPDLEYDDRWVEKFELSAQLFKEADVQVYRVGVS